MHIGISNLSASMSLAGCAPLFLLLLLHLTFARPLFPLPSKTKNEEKKPIQTFRPYNIAHRGSNGEIPEETAAAYTVLLRKFQALLICSRILYFYLAKE
jgi:glycerophosphoryl diester phosphodiesterase